MIAQGQTRPPPLYRVWQFIQALIARPLNPAERQEVVSILSPAQQALFRQMGASDQRHSLQVMRALLASGEKNHALLTAALLHDVGKSRYPLHPWERPLGVLAQLLRPRITYNWGNASPKGWKRPFVIYKQHPEWGAEMAAAAGCSPLAVQLIRTHQTQPGRETTLETKLLHALQQADNTN